MSVSDAHMMRMALMDLRNGWINTSDSARARLDRVIAMLTAKLTALDEEDGESGNNLLNSKM